MWLSGLPSMQEVGLYTPPHPSPLPLLSLPSPPLPLQLSHKLKVQEMASAAAMDAEHKDLLNENAEYKKKLSGVLLSTWWSLVRCWLVSACVCVCL